MVIFFGPAGSGKSVQGQLLAERKGWHWVSSGQILRDTHDKEILKAQNDGVLVLDDKVNQAIKKALSQFSSDDNLVIDGYPKHLEQAKWLMKNYSKVKRPIDLIVVFDVPKDELLKRMHLRSRADDTPDSINERLRIYYKEVASMLDYFKKEGVDIIHINGLGTIDQVHNKIVEEITKCNIL